MNAIKDLIDAEGVLLNRRELNLYVLDSSKQTVFPDFFTRVVEFRFSQVTPVWLIGVI